MQSSWLLAWLEFLFELLCCLFAILKGGPAEKAGAFLVMLAYMFAEIVFVLTWPHFPIFLTFASDFVLAVGLLVIAFRYGSVWLGFAMLLQSANLCSQALAFSGEGLHHQAAIILNNVLSLLMGASIGIGAFLSWRKRHQEKLRLRAQPAA